MGSFGFSRPQGQLIVNIEADVDTLASVLSGAAGIATFPTKAVAADAVSMAEVIRYISEAQLPMHLNKATAVLPQSTAGALFTITGGNIELLGIIGEVTTVIETQTNNTKLTYNPTGTGASTDLCTTLDITADAVGTLYSITGSFLDPLQSGLWIVHSLASPLILAPGTIDLDCDASNTGSVEWHLIYRLADAGASVA
ncbi:MAG: hypothetical protein ACYSVY_12715 [Planctomycetota bacterium]|jgi:hypothetical protein